MDQRIRAGIFNFAILMVNGPFKFRRARARQPLDLSLGARLGSFDNKYLCHLPSGKVIKLVVRLAGLERRSN